MSKINGTIMQYFHWYIDPSLSLWNEIKNRAKELADAGITALWLPPAYKGCNLTEPERAWNDVGYSTYDLFDLGEFDQKGAIRTRYGTREQYLAAIQAAHHAGIQIYADVVFKHKNAADDPEFVEAIPVAWNNRNVDMGHTRTIQIYSHFKFPGRQDKYSSLKWRWWHFDAVNHNASNWNDQTIYRLKDKTFETQVDPRHGNYDFLMACDLDTSNEEVRQELYHWGKWILETTGVDGFRLDAIKHISSSFFVDWLNFLRQYTGRELFTVGEYWENNVEALHEYISKTQGKMSLFDVPLHYNFHRASQSGGYYDMRTILNGTLMQQQPALAVTFVENHASQPLQALQSVVEPWFKPLAYAIILLRQEGCPCIFYADYYGAHYFDKGYEIWMNTHRWIIDKLLYARQHFAYGDQEDYFNHPDVIGWTRLGDQTHPQAMAIILSNASQGQQWMKVGKPHTQFYDVTEHIKEPVYTNEYGWGEFRCNGGSVSVWVQASF